MVGKLFALATFTVAGVMLADLLIHPQGTTVLANAYVSSQKAATNALLGKTS